MEEIIIDNLRGIIPLLPGLLAVGKPIVKDIIIPFLKKKGIEYVKDFLDKLQEKENNKDIEGFTKLIYEFDNHISYNVINQSNNGMGGNNINNVTGNVKIINNYQESKQAAKIEISDLAKRMLKELSKDEFGLIDYYIDIGLCQRIVINTTDFGFGANNHRGQREAEEAIEQLVRNGYIKKEGKYKYKITTNGYYYADTYEL